MPKNEEKGVRVNWHKLTPKKGSGLVAAHRRTTIGHENVQSLLRLFRIGKVPGLQHLAFVPQHLIDRDGIMLAVVRTIVIDTANVFVSPGQFP